MLRKNFKDLYYSYKRGYLVGFLGLDTNKLVLVIRRIYDRIKILCRPKDGVVLLHKYFKSNEYVVHFIIEKEYGNWTVGLRTYLEEHPIQPFHSNKTVYIGSYYNKIKQYKDKIDIVLDLSDLSIINMDLYNRVDLYIKREIKISDLKKYKKLIALPYLFSSTFYITKNILSTIKKSDQEQVYMSFGGNIGNGRLDILDKIKSKLVNSLYIYQASHIEYINIINKSKYSLNLHGLGQYCHRFTEIALSDSLMLCQKYTIEVPNDFIDMQNIVYFETVDELLEKIKYLDNNPDVYTNIFENFKKHYNAYHTHDKYCEMFLNLICS